MTEQERELFERRTVELAQARRVIDDLRERYTDVSKALSHVLHDNASLEAERDAALNAQEAAEKEVFALRARVSELEARTPRSYATPELRYLGEAPATPATPAIDESGEPAAYDVADTRPPGERVKVGDRVRVVWTEQRYERVGKVVCIDETRWPIEVMFDDSGKVGALRRDEILEILPESPVEPKAEDTRPPGERVKVGDRVRFSWPGGDVEGVVDLAPREGALHVKYAHNHFYAVPRANILEILPESP